MRERAGAERRDREALARSLEKGKADSGERAVAELEEKMAQARRRIDAADFLVDEAETALVATIEENRETLIRGARERYVQGREAYSPPCVSLTAPAGSCVASLSFRGGSRASRTARARRQSPPKCPCARSRA